MYTESLLGSLHSIMCMNSYIVVNKPELHSHYCCILTLDRPVRGISKQGVPAV